MKITRGSQLLMFIGVTSVLILLLAVFRSELMQSEQYKDSPTITNFAEKDVIEDILEQYLLEKNKDSYLNAPDSKFFCAVKIRWQKDLNNGTKVVFAPNQCAYVALKDGDLRGLGGGSDSSLLIIERIGDQWKVVDQDNRTISPQEPITQDWVREAEEEIPQAIKQRCFGENCFSTEGVLEKAAQYFGVQLPSYRINRCSKDSDCENNSLCVLSGTHSNRGPATCVKACDAHRDCGIAHSCISQCVKGENGCPDTAKNICVPDLYHYDLDKDPNDVTN